MAVFREFLLILVFIFGLSTPTCTATARRLLQFGPCFLNPCGNGNCISGFGLSYSCSCFTNYVSTVIGTTTTCVPVVSYYSALSSGLVAPASQVSSPTKSNTFFRYLSVSYSASPGDLPKWSLVRSLDWSSAPGQIVQPIRDQGTCRACASFSVASALESAFAIANMYSPRTQLSVQQLLNCGIDSCNGGWIEEAFDYMTRMTLVPEYVMPYLGYENSAGCSSWLLYQGQLGASMYETVSFGGTIGVVLAVMQQPVVAAVEASGASFLSYTGGVFNDPSCYKNGVDHTVVIVGYNLDAVIPYWIVRNSWGTNWGENGYMRLAITDGDGICGINVMPAMYPIPTGGPLAGNPCNSQYSYSRTMGTNVGRMNPCGGGDCRKYGSVVYNCTCRSPFVVGFNVDGTQTCVPGSFCAFSLKNPCGSGTCVDSTTTPGNYTCICPLGFKLGVRADNGLPNCRPVSVSDNGLTYVVPNNYNVTCNLVYTLFGISTNWFTQLNQGVNCSNLIPPGTTLNVTNNLGHCFVPYTVQAGDTCATIAAEFQQQLQGSISGPNSPNPGLNCTSLQPGQAICLQRTSQKPNSTYCTYPYTLSAGETCQSVIDTKLGGNTFLFYSLNPGIYCNLIGNVISNATLPTSVQVCLAQNQAGSVMQGCVTNKIASVQSGDSCSSIYSRYGVSPGYFHYLNGFFCTNGNLYVGERICVP